MIRQFQSYLFYKLKQLHIILTTKDPEERASELCVCDRKYERDKL